MLFMLPLFIANMATADNTPIQTVSRSFLEPFVGQYESGSITVTVILKGGTTLIFAVPGLRTFELVYTQGLSFELYTLSGNRIEFKKDASGAVIGLTAHLFNNTFIAKKKSDIPYPVVIVSPPNPAISKDYQGAYWSNEQLTADYPLERIEVAGTYKQIGCMLGQWYQAHGYVSQPFPPDIKETARACYGLIEKIYPGMSEQMKGVYVSYGLNLSEMHMGIPVWEGLNFIGLLPGVSINKNKAGPGKDSCSNVFVRPEMNTDGHARFGRNHDWSYPMLHTALIFTFPDTAGYYPTLLMTGGAPGFAAVDGINSKGLAIGNASVYLPYQPSKEPALIDFMALHLVLEKCANVAEAVALLRSIPVTHLQAFTPSHFLITDRGGASVVVEFLSTGIECSITDAPFQVMTNNYWAGPANKDLCWRYNKAVSDLISKQGQMDTDGMTAVMSSIRYSTQWTIIYDLQDLSMILTLPNDNFKKQYKFFLADFIARMEKRKKT